MRLNRGIVAGAVLLAALAACTQAPPAPPKPLRPSWEPVSLPPAPGAPGRALLRDAVTCGGRWFVVGGVLDAAGATRPAAWTSGDGRQWATVTLAPLRPGGYGELSVLYAAGCADGRLAAIGAKSGGAHGNPRVSSWYTAPNGALTEMTAAYVLYGGNDAVNVARIAGGPRGWGIAGNRKAGAAFWSSPDATDFALHEGVPELAADERGRTAAADVLAGDGGWLLVGSLTRPGRVDRDALGWTSPDGLTWSRVPGPATDGYEEFQRVTRVDGVPYAAGLRGDVFGAWRLVDGGWQDAGGFGATGGPVARVAGLAPADAGVLALVADELRFGLWLGSASGRWTGVELPGELPARGDAAAAVAAAGRRVVLLADDGVNSRVWIMDLAPDVTASSR
ncbi:hypothetical protein CS0771_72680 [Catellatospora sp. IY07-71]|uniref:hypothetical protein n=1 Tax=Catellatospora sp. IY07-71 TaxID=2728827 RepID=UPI001BB32853|nr:hypothetical protein [Catellatospora sp. IY07-71]BCJ77724.1 hypothetical protein CS0771_72680 [Catellatospora sp. IY07-71]